MGTAEADAERRAKPGRPWGAADEAYLLANYERLTLRSIARKLGRSDETVRQHLNALVRAGQADNSKRRRRGRWTEAEVDWMIARIGEVDWPYSAVAEKLGRSLDGLRGKLLLAGVSAPAHRLRQGTLNAERVCRILGVDATNSVVRAWIVSGKLPARRMNAHWWLIYPSDFAEFLVSHPECYDRRAMPRTIDGEPNPYRELARPGEWARYVPLKAAASILHVPYRVAWRWVRDGVLQARRFPDRPIGAPRPALADQCVGVNPNDWFILRRDVETLKAKILRGR